MIHTSPEIFFRIPKAGHYYPQITQIVFGKPEGNILQVGNPGGTRDIVLKNSFMNNSGNKFGKVNTLSMIL